MILGSEIVEPVLLEKQYKDHTVKNAVENLFEEMLPDNARTIHQQPIRNVEVTIQIIDEKDNRVLETITGKAESGSVKLDSSSLIRRTATLKLAIDPDLFPQRGSLIWFNRIAKVYVGIADMSKYGEVTNFLVGTYWIDGAGLTVDETSGYIDVKLSDKMSKYDGKKIENKIKIEPDTPIDEAIRLVMESAGETDFGYMDKVESYEVVPHTLEYGIGDTINKIIEELRDMYMDYVCGYSVSGQFELKKLKVQKEDEVATPKWRFDKDSEDGMDLTLSFTEDYSLKDIKNRIVVYGGTSEKTGLTPVGEVRITDPKSPFNVYAIGERTDIEIDDKYVTNEQCISKGKFEIWKSSNFQESCTITCPPIYIIDAFDIIEITHPVTKIVSRYQVDSIDYGLDISSPMSISAHKLYYISLEYGEEKLPLVSNIINGINNWGWLSLGEERIRDCYNIMGSGDASLIVRFQDVEVGGEQASVTSYPTTRNQTMMIDIADFANLDKDDPNGDGGSGSKGDYLDRVLGHEMFHAVVNDYYGHDIAVQLPIWFKEGFAEFIHGAKERFQNAYSNKTKEDKKKSLISLAESQLRGDWTGTSEDYVAAYLLAIGVYRLCSENQWKQLFIRLKQQKNPSINFLLKLLPIADTNDMVVRRLLDELENMGDVWQFLFNESDIDTGSVGGSHFMNLFNMPLDAETVFNNANATVPTLGFLLKIEK